MKNIKKVAMIILAVVLALDLYAPAVGAKTKYFTKKEIQKEIKEELKIINSGDYGSEDRWILNLDYQALKLVPSIKDNENFANPGDCGYIYVEWKNMVEDLDADWFKGIKWSSSNTKIATINQKGKVKFKKLGKVTITAKSITSGKTSKLKVTVEKPYY
jgi:hypothetical protein